MPACIVAERVVNLGTGTGTKSITLSLAGHTPALVVFKVWRTTLDADDSAAPDDEAVVSYGFTDGTNEAVWGVSSEHGASPRTNTYNWGQTDHCILMLDPATGGVDGSATISGSGAGFGANNVTIDRDNAASGNWKVAVWAIAGNLVSAEVGSLELSGTNGGTATINHSLGGIISGMIAAGAGSDGLLDDTAAVSRGRMCVGYGSYDGSSFYQSSYGLNWLDNVGASTSYQVTRADDSHIIAPPIYSAPPISAPAEPYAEWTAAASGTATITTRNASSPQDIIYALIQGPDCFAGMWDLPGSPTGEKDFTYPSGVTDFNPRGALVSTGRINYSGRNADTTNNRSGTIGFGGVGTSGVESCGTIHQRRNQDPTDTATNLQDAIFFAPPHTGAGTPWEGNWVSWNADGWTLDVTSINTNAKALPQLLVGIKDRHIGLEAVIAQRRGAAIARMRRPAPVRVPRPFTVGGAQIQSPIHPFHAEKGLQR
jgi:hypothetical protein